MQACQCDRCKTCYPRQLSRPVVEITVDNHPYDNKERLDLCPKCQAEIEIFLNIPHEKRTSWANVHFK